MAKEEPTTTAAQDNQIYFREISRVASARTYGHIRFQIDLQTLGSDIV